MSELNNSRGHNKCVWRKIVFSMNRKKFFFLKFPNTGLASTYYRYESSVDVGGSETLVRGKSPQKIYVCVHSSNL